MLFYYFIPILICRILQFDVICILYKCCFYVGSSCYSTLGSMWKPIKVLSRKEVQVVIKKQKHLLGKKSCTQEDADVDNNFKLLSGENKDSVYKGKSNQVYTFHANERLLVRWTEINFNMQTRGQKLWGEKAICVHTAVVPGGSWFSFEMSFLIDLAT